METAAAARSPSKRPLTPLAGPYGHPFHPILVTIPIGAWIAALVFDIASRSADDALVFSKGAYWLIGLGVVGAVLAAVLGVLDWLTIPRRTRAWWTGVYHLVLNLAVTGAFVVSFFVRRDRGFADPETSIGLIVLSAVALAVLAVSGWLGGMLAYRYGVRVVDEATQADGFMQDARVTPGRYEKREPLPHA
jgi:uncharacterized membrane protein